MPDGSAANDMLTVGEKVHDTLSKETVTILRLLTAGVTDRPVAAAVRRLSGKTEYRSLYELRREH